MNLYQIAESLGGDIQEGGINWTWVLFDSREAAEEFIRQVEARGGDHRGIYPVEDGKYPVRFR